jgi:hypothetical protein
MLWIFKLEQRRRNLQAVYKIYTSEIVLSRAVSSVSVFFPCFLSDRKLHQNGKRKSVDRDIGLSSNVPVAVFIDSFQRRHEDNKDSPTAGDEELSTNTLTLRKGTRQNATSPAVDSSLATMGYSIKTLAKATNLSEDAIAAAIALRQQQLIQQQQAAATSTTTTSTTTKRPVSSPVRKYAHTTPSKVMNAPREYYPVGYDKNFDDNFASRVELPDTTFNCGDQKHFPGLYADEDLGCMVSTVLVR